MPRTNKNESENSLPLNQQQPAEAEFSPEQSESTATTSPEAEEAEALDILSDMVIETVPLLLAEQIAAQVWAEVGKKLRARRQHELSTSFPQSSLSASPDGWQQPPSSLEVQASILPPADG